MSSTWRKSAAATPAKEDHFEVKSESEQLSKDEADNFHSIVAK